MTSRRRSRTQLALYELKKLRRKASTRDNAYHYLSEKYGIKVSSIRAAASRAGLTSMTSSLKRIFSKEEEEALVEVCIRQARQYKPFTIRAFSQVARKFAGSLHKPRKFTKRFVSGFMKRHRKVLHKKKGKLTSPTRSSKNTFAKTEAFIDSLNRDIESNRINSQNIVVFDETIIGDSVTVPVVIGERRNSGGDNINFVQTRQARLGSYIPFSMPDGTTPFRVFVFKSDDLGKKGAEFEVLKPIREEGFRSDVYRLYLSSGTGYLNKTLFEYVMVRFVMWWKSSHGHVDCFLISDNLPTHKNKDIVAYAESMGIHMYNIMPGSSHWFQVHDQQPFGALKKKMVQKKFDLWTSTEAQPKEGVDLLLCLFYQAEGDAFEPQVLRKTFEYVGLWPWNPQKILNNCRENCPVEPPLHENRLVKKLLKIINDMDEENKRLMQHMMSEMKRERVITEKELKKKMTQERILTKKLFGVRRKKKARIIRETMNKSMEPPCKRARRANYNSSTRHKNN